MLNLVTLIGRLTDDVPKPHEFENGNKVVDIILAVRRPFKNLEGVYDTDFIKIKLKNNLAEIVPKYIKKGDLITAVCRIQVKKELINDKNIYLNELIGERVVFLQQSKISDPLSDDIKDAE